MEIDYMDRSYFGALVGRIQIEWVGSLSALAGAFLLAANSSAFSPLGWVAFLVSNASFLSHGFRNSLWWMVTMQVGFTGTSLLGIYNNIPWFLDFFSKASILPVT